MNGKLGKKVLSLALSALLIGSALPMGAAATEPEVTNPVAEIGEQGYATLQGAIDAVTTEEGEAAEIKLLANVEENITIANGENVVLDLAGKKITAKTKRESTSGRGGNDYARGTIVVEGGGTLTVEDSGENGTVDNAFHGNAALANDVGGTVILNGGTFDRSAETGSSATSAGPIGSENSWYTIKNLGTMTINDGVTIQQGKKTESESEGTWTGKYSSLLANGWANPENCQETSLLKEADLTIIGGTFVRGLYNVKNDEWGKVTILGGNFYDGSVSSLMNWNIMTIKDGTFRPLEEADTFILEGAYGDHAIAQLTISDGTFGDADLSTANAIRRTSSSKKEQTGGIEVTGGTFMSTTKFYAFDEGVTPAVVTATGGTYMKAPKADEIGEDAALIGITQPILTEPESAAEVDPTAETRYYVDTVANLTSKANEAVKGDAIEVLKGAFAFTNLPGGVKVTNSGTGNTVTANGVKVESTPVITPYTVKIKDAPNSTISPENPATGATVTIKAGTKGGRSFKGWIVAAGGVTLADASVKTTTFVMPEEDVVLTAKWGSPPAPVETPAPTAAPTATPSPSATPAPTTSPEPTATPDPSASPAPTATPVPTVTPVPTPKPNPGEIVIGGEVLEGAKEEVDGEQTTVTVDQEKLGEKLKDAEAGSDFVVPVSDNAKSTVELAAQNMEDLSAKEMTLKVLVDTIVYELPGAAVDIEALKSAFPDTELKDVSISISVSKSDQEVEGAVLPPIDFTVSASHNGETVALDVFQTYTGRSFELTEEEAEAITTAVVVEPDGKLRPVPTVINRDGASSSATIHSRTNSVYALISSELDFVDSDNTWFDAVADEAGSRMIMTGVSGLFEGKRNITRAEFALTLIRALGLPMDGDASQFTDVPEDSWYAGAVGTAYAYGLIKGQTETLFAPKAQITREEAMTMIHRASKLTKFEGTMGDLSQFSDGDQASNFAKEAAAWNVGSGMILGDRGLLKPTAFITRAETATVILRLLEKAELI